MNAALPETSGDLTCTGHYEPNASPECRPNTKALCVIKWIIEKRRLLPDG